VAGLAAKKIYEAATHGHDFRTMLEHNPDLEEHRRRDPRLFNQHFTSLRNANPQFSADPIIAGTFMRQMAENPLNAGNTVREAISGASKMHSFLGQMGEDASGFARDSVKDSLKLPKQPQANPGQSWGRDDD
jgi:hypothetical protein